MAPARRVLGLDIAKRTGYAIAEGDRIIRSGVRDFSVKSHEHNGHAGTKFYNFLLELGMVDEVYFEELAFGAGKYKKADGSWGTPTNDGRELQHGLIMVMRMFCAGLNIHPQGVNPMTLKKAFTGHGHATKEDMCAHAHSLGWKGGQAGTALFHDEVDACALVYTQLRNKHGIIVKF